MLSRTITTKTTTTTRHVLLDLGTSTGGGHRWIHLPWTHHHHHHPRRCRCCQCLSTMSMDLTGNNSHSCSRSRTLPSLWQSYNNSSYSSLPKEKDSCRRKHFWTREQLDAKADRLIRYCRGEFHDDHHDEPSSTNKKKPKTETHRQRRQRFMEFSESAFYDALEAYMEIAKMTQQHAGNSSSGLAAADRARELLWAMRTYSSGNNNNNNNSHNGNPLLYTPKAFYDVVLQAYAVSNGGRTAAEQAESILQTMLQDCKEYIQNVVLKKSPTTRTKLEDQLKPPPEPNLKTFNIVLNCWSKSAYHAAGLRAARVLRIMEEWTMLAHTTSNGVYMGDAYPNEWSLVSLVDAWTRSGHVDAPERAYKYLQEAMKMKPSGSDHTYKNVQLDTPVFNAVIYAHCMRKDRESAEKAEEILQLMIGWQQTRLYKCGDDSQAIRPNTRTYSLVLDAWAQCEGTERDGESAKRAEKILRSMIQKYRRGEEQLVKPNWVSFTTCIAAWARAAAHIPEAAGRAEAIWDELVELYEETEGRDPDFRPTTDTGNALISAWSRCTNTPSSVVHATSALKRLQRYDKADLVSYNALLDAQSKKGMGDQAHKLLCWLERTSQLAGNEYLRPDIISYNSVLAAYSRSNSKFLESAQKAERLFHRMEELGGTLRPNKQTYTSLIVAWSRSDSPRQYKLAQSLIDLMVKHYRAGDDSLKPDVIAYTALMKACVHVVGQSAKREALSTALEAMKILETEEFGPPNHVAYATILKVFNYLAESEDQRLELLKLYFLRCIRGGHLCRDAIEEMTREENQRLFLEIVDEVGGLSGDMIVNVPWHDRATKMNDTVEKVRIAVRPLEDNSESQVFANKLKKAE